MPINADSLRSDQLDIERRYSEEIECLTKGKISYMNDLQIEKLTHALAALRADRSAIPSRPPLAAPCNHRADFPTILGACASAEDFRYLANSPSSPAQTSSSPPSLPLSTRHSETNATQPPSLSSWLHEDVLHTGLGRDTQEAWRSFASRAAVDSWNSNDGFCREIYSKRVSSVAPING
jgi:hypothetical protein